MTALLFMFIMTCLRGKINLVSGPRMAGAVCFGVHVIGKSGHGSRPDLAKNPVIPASHIVCELIQLYKIR